MPIVTYLWLILQGKKGQNFAKITTRVLPNKQPGVPGSLPFRHFWLAKAWHMTQLPLTKKQLNAGTLALKGLAQSIFLFLFLSQVSIGSALHAQDTLPPIQVGPKPSIKVLLPLHLDSAFGSGKYAHGNQLPSYLIPGLEFFNGVKLASDQLREEGITARIQMIDLKAANWADQLVRDTTYEDAGIVIAAPQSAAELKAIADRLKGSGTPLLSLLPNDAGITDYPNLLIANSTLRTHCTQLYKYLQRNHSIDNILLLTPKGGTEERLKNFINEEHTTTPAVPLKWKSAAVADNFSVGTLLPLLDSTRYNALVLPTLNSQLAQKIIAGLATVSATYRIGIFGMPTWENLPLSKSEFRGVEVYYGTPFVTSTADEEVLTNFTTRYRSMTNSRPSDMAFRGYEITYRYAKTLSLYKQNFVQHVNNYAYKVFTDFRFEPVHAKAASAADYHENNRIYFIKKLDGNIQQAVGL